MSQDVPDPVSPRPVGPVPARQRPARPGGSALPTAQMPRPTEAYERHDKMMVSVAPRIVAGLVVIVSLLGVLAWLLQRTAPTPTREEPRSLAERVAERAAARAPAVAPVALPPSDLELEAAVERADWARAAEIGVLRARAGLSRADASSRLVGLLRRARRFDEAEALLAAIPSNQQGDWAVAGEALLVALDAGDRPRVARRWLGLPFLSLPEAERERFFVLMRPRLLAELPADEAMALLPEPFPGGEHGFVLLARIGIDLAAGRRDQAGERLERGRGDLNDGQARLALGDFSLADGDPAGALRHWRRAVETGDALVALEVLRRAGTHGMSTLAAVALPLVEAAGFDPGLFRDEAVLIVLARLLRDDPSGAREAIDALAQRLDPDLVAYLRLRVALLAGGLDVRSLTALGLLADRRPDLPMARASEVVALASLGREKAAVAAMGLLEGTRPEHEGSWLGRELRLAAAALEALASGRVAEAAKDEDAWTPLEQGLLLRAARSRRP